MEPSLNEPDYRFNEKWHAEIGALGFTMIPNALLINYVHLGLTPSEFLLLINIESYRWNSKKLPYPSVETLAMRTGMTTRTVSRIVTSLDKDRSVLKRIKRKGTSNQYSLDPLIVRLLELIRKERGNVLTGRIDALKADISSAYHPAQMSPKEYPLNKDILKENIS